jgi:CheY-like chemotaxis protein
MSGQYINEQGTDSKQTILIAGTSWKEAGTPLVEHSALWNYEWCSDLSDAIGMLKSGQFAGILAGADLFNSYETGIFSFEHRIVQNIRSGLVVLGLDQKIIWHNRQFREWIQTDNVIGKRFFPTLGFPEMLGPDYSPLTKVRTTGKYSVTLLCLHEPVRYITMDTTPVFDKEGKVIQYVVRLMDVTEEQTQKNKWDKIHEACKELADLSKQDILSRSPSDRVNILKAKIAKFAQEILEFAIIEIRTVSRRTQNLLEPLLAIGMSDDAVHRTLYVSQDDNGITGWTAYHRRSYKMDDANEDPFYLEGIAGARSSITSPLLYRGSLIGTFNVESTQPKAFDDNDLKLLEFFADAVAQTIHTLDLFDFEYKDTAYKSIEKVYSAAAQPLNQILLETARLRSGKIVDRSDLFGTLATVQHYARKIQEAFQGFVAELAPALPPEISATDCINYPMLRDKRILMVDSDETTGKELRRILFYYGCTVETATNGENALKMLETAAYDVYMSDIKLPDMSAFAFFKLVRCFHCRLLNGKPPETLCSPPEEDPCCHRLEVPYVPFVYMRAFGYDTAHVMPRAIQAGVIKPIFKPFVLNQLLDTLKSVIAKDQEQRRRFPKETA